MVILWAEGWSSEGIRRAWKDVPPFPGVGWGAASHRLWAQMSKPRPGRSGMTGIKKTLPQALGQLQPHLAHCRLFANKVLLTAAPTCVRVSYGCFCRRAAEWRSHHRDPPGCRAGDIHSCAPHPHQHGSPVVTGTGPAHISVASLTDLWLCCLVTKSCLPLL